MPDVEIRDCPALRLFAILHRGAYPKMGQAYGRLSTILSAAHLWPEVRGMVGIFYDSPDVVPEPDLRCHAAFVVSEQAARPEEVEELQLAAGPHVVLTHRGPYEGLAAAWQHLYAQALPQLGVTPAERPPFEVYLNDPTQVAAEDLLTEIHVPLAAG